MLYILASASISADQLDGEVWVERSVADFIQVVIDLTWVVFEKI